jgi:hypothetical protein
LNKNLGPCIIEHEEYIKRIFSDHLLDSGTYQQLSQAKAASKVDATYTKVNDFLTECSESFTKEDVIFLHCFLEVLDPFAYFYILAKVHKFPWNSCPIVSVRGSITHGLGHWLDQQLQPICLKLPAYLKSALELKPKLNTLTYDSSKTQCFAAKATSIYTNIDTVHALSIIATFLWTSPLCADLFNTEGIVCALELIMHCNHFRFSNAYWLQLTGTAMGTPLSSNVRHLVLWHLGDGSTPVL